MPVRGLRVLAIPSEYGNSASNPHKPDLSESEIQAASPCAIMDRDSRIILDVGRMDEAIYTRCCIAGGGPAGVMLGFLLARMGIDVFVLEKHADFLRDFRGDTIHPSTLEIMHELGILDEFLKRPHQEIRELAGQ